jgi:2-dehydro-3-deoxy-D-gluconate 5-dehydrogenase
MSDNSRDLNDLSGQVAVIVCAGNGVDEATAVLLARHGADVVVGGQPRALLDALAARVRRHGRRSLALVADVRRAKDCATLINETVEELGQIDILINHSGGHCAQPLEQLDAESWQSMLDRDLRSVFVLSQLASRHMTPRRGGVIVNVCTETLGIGGRSGGANAVAMAGVGNLTRAMASAWRAHGIRVNCIAISGATRDQFRASPRGGRDPESDEAEAIASTILFCACRGASFISGQTITIAGEPRPFTLA